MNKVLIKRLEFLGGAIVFSVASFLHFFYELSGKSVIGALLGAVNESIWEHMKIFALAYIFWGVTELLWAKPSIRPFVVAKTVGLCFLLVEIPLFFYSYTLLTGKPILAVDLISAFVFSFLAHIISLWLTNAHFNNGQFFYTAVMILLLIFLMILSFTYFPVKAPLFRDFNTGLYGITPSSLSIADTTQISLF